MPVVLADYDAGTLTGLYILLLSGLGVALCLIFAGVMWLLKQRRAVRGALIAAGVVFGLAILLFCLAIGFGKTFHLL